MVVGTSGILVGELPGGSSAAIAEDEEGTKNGVEEYVSSDGTFALRFPAGFKGFSKPLKTHKVEVRSDEWSFATCLHVSGTLSRVDKPLHWRCLRSKVWAAHAFVERVARLPMAHV